MDKLSYDELLSIFQYLNPREQNRYALLSKQTQALKARYPKDFRKPTVAITICPMETSDDGNSMKLWKSERPKYPERMLTISTPKRSLAVEVSSDGKVFTADNDDSKILMKSFLHRDESVSRSWWTLSIPEKTVAFKDFSNWLFSTFDVSVLLYAKENSLSRLILYALIASKCRCFEVSIVGSLNDAIPKNQDLNIIDCFRKKQDTLEINIKLRLEKSDAIQEYASSDVLSMGLFNEVIIEYNPQNFYKFIVGVGNGWRGHFLIRAHFENSSEKTSNVFKIFFDVVGSWNANVINFDWEDVYYYLNLELPDKMEKDWDLEVPNFLHDIRFHFSMDGPNFSVSAQRKPEDEKDIVL